MATDQEAIETFMSITGVDEVTAIQKLEVIILQCIYISAMNMYAVLLLFLR